MKLLSPGGHATLSALIDDAEYDLAVPAIASGRARGQVFADDPHSPRLALVSPHWGRLYLLGRPSSAAVAELCDLLREAIWPDARAAGARVFTLAYPPDWQPYLPELLDGKRVEHAEREYYRWNGKTLPPARVPDGFTLIPVDAHLLADTGVAGLELLAEEMVSERASVEDFLANSFGIAAIQQGEVAGFCLSEYNLDARCEVGIATIEPFRRQGLAAAMGRAFLEMARDRGVTSIGWHCWKQNLPSAAAARKIGLEPGQSHLNCRGRRAL